MRRHGLRMQLMSRLTQSSEKVDRSLEKVTNDKIMAISEYSDTVIESMNKTHNEIMFLYSMLNDKHTELTGMAADLQRLAADVRSLRRSTFDCTGACRSGICGFGSNTGTG